MLVAASCAAAGNLARGFGAGGVVKLRGVAENPSKLATGPGGGIFLLGRDDCGGGCDYHLTVTKLSPDGVLERRYGVEGVAATIFEPHEDAVFAVDRRGRALVMTRKGSGGSPASLVRLNSAGTLDRSFGVDGVATTPAYGNSPDLGIQLAGRDGFYAVASWRKSPLFVPSVQGRETTGVISIARFGAGGSADGGYGSGGEFRHNFTDVRGLGAAAERRSGGVVVFGTTCCGGKSLPTAARVNARGRLDRRFGLWQGFGGIRRVAWYQATDAVVRRNGKIDLYGTAHFKTGKGGRGFAVRLRRNGRPFGRFGQRHGIRFAAWPFDQVALDGRSRTVALVYAFGFGRETGVFRLRPGGAPDRSFASGGLASTPFPIYSENVSLGTSRNRPLVLDEAPEACAFRGPPMCIPANPTLVAFRSGPPGKRRGR